MKTEPEKAYVYQPLATQEDGKSYGVGGLHLFGISMEDAKLIGITKSDAERIASHCNQSPETAAAFIRDVKERLANDWLPGCGCRFKSLFSNSVLLCKTCEKLPCHSGG